MNISKKCSIWLTLLSFNLCFQQFWVDSSPEIKSGEMGKKRTVNQKSTAASTCTGDQDECETCENIAQVNNSEFYLIDEYGNSIDCKESIRESALSDLALEENSESITTYSTKDANENNNSFSKASSVYSAASRTIGYYGLTSSWWASIHEKSDVDFYSYDVIMNGTLEVTLSNIPVGCDYDLQVYRMGNSLTSSCDDAELIASSTKGSNNSENVLINVTPGTYYVKVYSYNENSCDDQNYYHIEFVTTDGRTFNEGHYKISEHKVEGDLAAIWKSDLDPCSQKVTYSKVTGSLIKYENHEKFPLVKHLAEKYDENSDIDYACLYVWDLDLRKAIYNVAGDLYSLIASHYTNVNETLEDINLVMNGRSLVLSVAGVVLGSIPIVGTALGVSSLIASIVSVIAGALNSSFTAKVNDVEQYLIALKQAMEVGRGTSDEEVIMMRIRYRFTKTKFLWAVTGRYIDIHQVYRNTDVYLYNSDWIDFYHDGSPINGSITGIKSADDLSEVLK